MINHYRLNVGMVILNEFNRVFVGRRINTNSYPWQMPQGDIQENETLEQAVMREMIEEVGSNKAHIIKESKNWYQYDIPKKLLNKTYIYTGQKQKWFLLKFYGNDSDINIKTQNPEFSKWKWINAKKLSKIVIYFKKNIYIKVLKEFESFF